MENMIARLNDRIANAIDTFNARLTTAVDAANQWLIGKVY
jgi:hypothetical protein